MAAISNCFTYAQIVHYASGLAKRNLLQLDPLEMEDALVLHCNITHNYASYLHCENADYSTIFVLANYIATQ